MTTKKPRLMLRTTWRTAEGNRIVIYKKWVLRIEKMKGKGYGALAFKNGKPRVVYSGHQQFIGIGNTQREAIEDAKTSIDKFFNKIIK